LYQGTTLVGAKAIENISGFSVCVRTRDSALSPEGTAECAAGEIVDTLDRAHG